MRFWVLTFQEKCPAGKIEIDYFIDLLKSQGIQHIVKASGTSLIFQSRDMQDWKYWEKIAKQHLEPVFYYSILELKNSNCKPVGLLRPKEFKIAA